MGHLQPNVLINCVLIRNKCINWITITTYYADDYEVMLVEALENVVANDTPQVDDFECVEEIVSTYETDSETRNA